MKAVRLDDFEDLAREHLGEAAYDYFAGGACDEVTLRDNREALLAFRIEEALSKDQILELYLNEIFLGLNSYGVAAAALNYFGKPLNELTLPE
ncbi:MAG: transglycosylase domain-containing protein, partial [Candidatus Binatia bacterium]